MFYTALSQHSGKWVGGGVGGIGGREFSKENSTALQVCVTVSNSPNPSFVQMSPYACGKSR